MHRKCLETVMWVTSTDRQPATAGSPKRPLGDERLGRFSCWDAPPARSLRTESSQHFVDDVVGKPANGIQVRPERAINAPADRAAADKEPD